MRDEAHISFVIDHLSGRDRRALRRLSGPGGLRAAVKKLCREGEDSYNAGIIPDQVVRRLKDKLFRQLPPECEIS
jgi:hypothetical protein